MTRGTHSTVEQAPAIGDAIGRYRIIGVLGDGSLGRLYLAQQHGIRGISKTVALRCIRSSLADNTRFRARFSEAASIATRSVHPNIVTVFEMSNIDGRYFISMEYLPGESLASLINQCNTRDPPTPDDAAYVVKQTAAAVQYFRDLRQASAQRVSLLHEEVGTSNVFVSYQGGVKWLGIGLRSLAKELESSEADALPEAGPPTRTETVDVDADRHIDVFNLGVLLWTCLVGEKPTFVTDSAALDAAVPDSTILAKPALPLPAPSSVRADVPDALDTIVKQALSSVRREQFPSPRELAEALDRYLLRREPRPTPKQLRRWMEQSFGAERASLQMQIARGRDVEAALSRLRAPQQPGGGTDSRNSLRMFSPPRPRALWSTSHSVFSQLGRASIAPRSFERIPGSTPEESSHITAISARHRPSSFVSAPSSLASAELPPLQSPPPPASRAWLASTLTAACAVLALGLALILVTSSPSSLSVAALGSPAPERDGRVDVRSRPQGAAVFVDGEPTGLHTPVLLKGLTAGRVIHLRVEKAGFASQAQRVAVAGGSVVTREFELLASDARVRFEGAPPDARIYVDDMQLAGGPDAPVNLSVGSHFVRVETPSTLVFSGQVDIVAGEQAINVGDGRSNP
jgi:serine/threonine protein kinase